MRARTQKAIVMAAGVALAAAACGGGSSSGSSPSASNSSSSANLTTITVGLLTELSGLGASGQAHALDGVNAGRPAAKQAGYNIVVKTADTQSTPAGALAAAKTLVQRDHVDVVIAHSSITYACAQYLLQNHIPVIGPAEDGPEWTVYKNMFSVYGAVHTNVVTTTSGEAFKKLGATNVASVGYTISPTSAEAAKGNAISVQAAGLQAGYTNSQFPFGSTNVQPVAIAMKNAGIDGLAPELDPNSSFALVTALRNEGVDLKAVLLPIGYGGDLLQAGPGTLKAAQNIYFGLSFEPMEMQTAATKTFAAALAATGGTSQPGLPTYDGYASVLMLIQGLQAAGSNPTRASILTGLQTIHKFTAGGLFGTHVLDPNNRGTNSGLDNCSYYTKLVGSKFVLVPGLDPICGTIIPGKTVTP